MRPVLLCALLAVAVAAAAAQNADFEGCLTSGANAEASRRGTSIRYVDPWNKQSDSQKYNYYVTATTTQYPMYNVQKTPGSYALYSTAVNNTECATTVTTQFQRSEGYTNTFSVAVTETLQIQETLKVTAKILDFGIEDTTQITTTISSTQTATTSTTSTFSVSETILTPASTYEAINFLCSTIQFSGDFQYRVDFSGNVPIWFNDKVALNNDGDYHWLWFVWVGEAVQWGIDTGDSKCQGFANNGWTAASFTGTSHVSGMYGFNGNVQLAPQKIPCVDPTSSTLTVGGTISNCAAGWDHKNVTLKARMRKQATANKRVRTRVGRWPIKTSQQKYEPAPAVLENAIRAQILTAHTITERAVASELANPADPLLRRVMVRDLKASKCDGAILCKIRDALTKKVPKAKFAMAKMQANTLLKAAGCETFA